MWLALFQQSVVNGPRPGAENTYYLEIALVVLASFLFGYILRLFLNQRYHKEIEELNDEILKLRSNTNDPSGRNQSQPDSKLQADNEKLRQNLDKAKAELGLVQKAREAADKKVKELEQQVNKQSESNKGQRPPDDLTRIEGIGPKLAFILNEKGISTYEKLADHSEKSLQKILDNAGPAFKIMDASSWPKQAKLASEEKWKELAELQEKLIDKG
jgi:predicted flap endonuclease-1-like 5' DNA nuclease